MTDTPNWMEKTLESISGAVESTGAPGSIGYEYYLDEDVWNILVFPLPVEIIEDGSLEYGTVGFSVDIEPIRSMFENIAGMTMASAAAHTDDPEDVVFSINGNLNGHPVFLRILTNPTEDADPKFRIFVEEGGTRIEEIVRSNSDSDDEEELSYGAVAVIDGEHAGKIGYYDDDEGSFAIVYFGKPFESEYHLVPREKLRNVTSLEHEKFKREYPELCDQMGID
ncbi:MAG: hypothetical protein NTV34_10710 [Proteobacteria bacterium]|nr:hypothetical protein [Pseudomonadota bacterium]